MGISCRPKRVKTSQRRASWASAAHPNAGRPAQGEHHGHQLSAQTREDQPKASIMGISCPLKRGKTSPRRASWASAVGPNARRPAKGEHHGHQLSTQTREDQPKASIMGISCRPKRVKTSHRRASWVSAVHPNACRPAKGEHHGHQLSTQTREDQPKASIMGISCPPKRGKTSPRRASWGISCRPKRGKTKGEHHGHQLSTQTREDQPKASIMGISCPPKRGKTSPRRASWASAVGPNASRPAKGEHHGHQLSTQTREDQPKASIMGISCRPKREKTSQRRASWASAVHPNA